MESMDEIQKKEANRGVVLAAIAVTGLILGSNYLWSIFSGPLRDANGWLPSQVSMVYSVNLLASCIANFFAGAIQERFPIRRIILVCGVLYSGGWILTSFSHELWQLYLFYVLLVGGIGGIIYNTVISVAVRWYPDRKGFANGICIASMGIAPLVVAPLANAIVERFDVFMAFRIFGSAYVVILLVISALMQVPDPDWKPAGWVKMAETVNVHGRERTSAEMMRTPAFWMVWAMLSLGLSTGTMMSGHLSNIGQQVLGLTAAQGALLVSIFALVNTASRLTLAPLSDRVGRFPILCTVMGLTAVDMAFVLGRTSSFVTFALAIAVVAMGFGATMAILPAIVSDLFGQQHFSTNYSFLYSGYTVASFIGPTTGAMFLERTGSYEGAFAIMGGLALLGMIFAGCAARTSHRL